MRTKIGQNLVFWVITLSIAHSRFTKLSTVKLISPGACVGGSLINTWPSLLLEFGAPFPCNCPVKGTSYIRSTALWKYGSWRKVCTIVSATSTYVNILPGCTSCIIVHLGPSYYMKAICSPELQWLFVFVVLGYRVSNQKHRSALKTPEFFYRNQRHFLSRAVVLWNLVCESPVLHACSAVKPVATIHIWSIFRHLSPETCFSQEVLVPNDYP